MRRNILLLSLIMVFSCCLFAQETYKVSHLTIENYAFQEEADFHYLLADMVNLRTAPTTSSKVVTTLPIGSKMIILEANDSTTVINGIESNWYKIEVNQKTGWLWGGFIATYAFGSEKDSSIKFVIGLEKKEAGEGGGWFLPVYQIRAFKNNKEIDRISVKSFNREIESVVNIGNKGLKNLDDILMLHVPCVGGCGCSTGELYVFWHNNKFYHIGNTVGMADADYSVYEFFVFPAAMEGEAPYIIKISGFVDDEKTTEDETVRKVIREYYLWNGTKFYKADKAKEEMSYKLY